MRLNQVSAKTGFLWFRQGIRLFLQNPFALLAIFSVYVLALMVFSLVPVLGAVLPLLLFPAFVVGFMTACRATLNQQPFSPLVLAAGLRTHGDTVARQLLLLGLWYTAATISMFLIASLADGGTLIRLMLSDKHLNNQMLATSALRPALLVVTLTYIPVAMLFWFAPILSAWHSIPAHKAVFFSWIACWRNRGAFSVYGLLWIGFAFMLSFTLITVLHLFGLNAFVLPMLLPASITLMAMFYCSLYQTYLSCFPDESQPVR